MNTNSKNILLEHIPFHVQLIIHKQAESFEKFFGHSITFAFYKSTSTTYTTITNKRTFRRHSLTCTCKFINDILVQLPLKWILIQRHIGVHVQANEIPIFTLHA